MRGPGIVSEARQHLRTSPPTDSLLTCLMETVVVDDVVTSASAGRCHPVCPTMTVECRARSATGRRACTPGTGTVGRPPVGLPGAPRASSVCAALVCLHGRFRSVSVL